MLFKTTNAIITKIDEFIDAVDLSAIVFKEGVKNYLNNDMDSFNFDLERISKLEAKADNLRRNTENELYIHSLLPQFRSDVLRILEKMDDVVDTTKENLYQYEVEVPKIPEELNEHILKLTEVVCSSVESLVFAARSFFRDVKKVKDRIHRVYFYEKEADRLANKIKRQVFQEMPNLKLSEKQHLRYFTLHIENISDIAENVADILAISAIKRIV